MEKQNKKTKCIVTGGAGFIGSHLVDELVFRGFEAAVIDDLSAGNRSYVNQRAKFYHTDIRDREKLDEIFERESADGPVDCVFHLAAQIEIRTSVEKPTHDADVNILGGINVIDACRRFNVKKFIFSSSVAVYGEPESFPVTENTPANPISPYGLSKFAFEHYIKYYCRNFNLSCLIFRFANVYGPRQYHGGDSGVISIFTDNIANHRKSKIYGDGAQTRDYVFVGDLVKALAAGIDSDCCGVANLSTGKETSLLEVMNLIESAAGRKMEKEFLAAKPCDAKRFIVDNQKARTILGWEPETDIETGIKKTVDWALKKKNGKEKNRTLTDKIRGNLAAIPEWLFKKSGLL